MSQASSQAWAFYREVAKNRVVWTIRDTGGFPAPITSDGSRAQPFWSSCRRVERIIKNVPAFSGFEPFEISWNDFCERWVPGLSRDRVKIGVNWSGSNATGYDLEPELVRQYVEAVINGDQPTDRVPPP